MLAKPRAENEQAMNLGLSELKTATKEKGVQIPARFYSLDILRGIAALSVVLHHWQHFFIGIVPFTDCKWMQLPFSIFLGNLLNGGHRGIHVFFSLSGFIFFWLYSDRIEKKTITFKEFCLLRFSRLYPLHLVTLLFVFAAQFWIYSLQREFFVYKVNDIYHLALNLIFASNWGFEKDMSLNGPSWSTSVEILLYGFFFVLCALRMTRWWQLALIALVGEGMIILEWPTTGMHHGIGSGVHMFFLGGVSFRIYQHLKDSSKLKEYYEAIILVLVSVWILVWLSFFYGFAVWVSFCVESARPIVWYHLFFNIFIIQFTIISLALLETYRGTLGKRFSVLGDISYSCYMINFPLQIVFAGIIIRLGSPLNGTDRSVFYSPWMLLGFLAVLLFSSYLSFRYFERPVQEFLRKKWGLRKSGNGVNVR